MAKPFNIRPPEDVAFAYGFDKARIAQAVADNDLDETSAVMAAMLINAGERQKAMQAGQQPTVAQQAFAPPAPQQPAGLGATPQAAAMPPMGAPPEGMGMPPQEMAAPQEMPMMADGGMVPPYASGGGLSDVPVPDGMFDEPSNGGFGDGYAGGGMVAFAGGGPTGSGWGDYIEQTVRKLDPNIQITGRARTPERNAQLPGAVANSYHLINAARDVRTPDGMKKSDFIAQLKSVLGSDYDVLPSAGNSVHIEPGPKLGKKVRAGIPASNAPATAPERDISTAEGRNMSMEDALSLGNRFVARSPEQEAMREEARARYEEMRSPETYEKERKADMWQTLAEIGFNMASSKAPSVLQALGEAASAALPGARTDKKERKELKDRALQGLMQLSEGDEKLARDGLSIGMDIAKSGREAEQFERKLEADETRSNLDRAAQIEAAKISSAGKTTDLESATEIIYASLVKSNAQRLLTKDGKPFNFAPEALRRRALAAAARLIKPPKADTDVLGALQLGGASGTGTGGSTVVDYGALEQ